VLPPTEVIVALIDAVVKPNFDTLVIPMVGGVLDFFIKPKGIT